MKGKIILKNIDHPVEGMQVVYGNELNPYRVGTYSGVVNLPNNHQWNGLHVIKESPLAPWDLSDLKQIVVEYTDINKELSKYYENGIGGSEKQTLPLDPSQWSWALAFIGHELEFTIHSTYRQGDGKCFCNTVEKRKKCEHFTGPPINDCLLYNGEQIQYARITIPTPVRTMEDIPEGLRHKYPADFDGNLPPDSFWVKRHRENIKLLEEKDKEILLLVKNNNDLKNRCEKLELQLSTPVEESWDDIFNRYANGEDADGITIWDWLEQYYNPPTKRK